MQCILEPLDQINRKYSFCPSCNYYPNLNSYEFTLIQYFIVLRLEEIVLEDIAVIKEYPLLRKEVRNAVRGFIFDIYSGLVTEVFKKA